MQLHHSRAFVWHNATIGDNAFIFENNVIRHKVTIGANLFLGVNCTFNDKILPGKNNLVGSGALVVKNSEDVKLLIGAQAKPFAVSSLSFFKVPEDER